jgi:Holliday junction resolvase RusA-like endonuclease
MISFTVFGNPVAQGRPKFARRGNFVTTYDPVKSKDYKQQVYQAALPHAPTTPLVCPLCVEICAYMEIPKSWSKAKQEAAREQKRLPISRPDVDNIGKSVTDSINGLIYKDDSQIVELNLRKVYADIPRVEVDIREVG